MYTLLDSGEGMKLEQYGQFRVARPDGEAPWPKALTKETWSGADAVFTTSWKKRDLMPDSWSVIVGSFKFKISIKNFKHTGVFPEHVPNWDFISSSVKNVGDKRKLKILNLFGYTGGATLALAKVGAEVVHVDASKPSITAARENVKLNGFQNVKIQWILDDVRKFVNREIRRGVKYDGVIMDPPSFGRGAKGEVWKIEKDLLPLLQSVKKILIDEPKFVLLNGYASGFTPLAYAQLLSSVFGFELKEIESGELLIKESSARGFSLPAGIFARWAAK